MSSSNAASAEFTSFYLQQATKEFAEDLDKARSADDFKGDALPLLIQALQQGTALFSSADQRRVTDAGKPQLEEQEQDDEQMGSAKDESSSSSGSATSDEED
ncbi:hypothetical protein KJ359_011167 [Pestalotiopsis sp. 9143b]|nr:hypothetical protein KJ359_011167 [Pestalotiopsis sp. 9143b]